MHTEAQMQRAVPTKDTRAGEGNTAPRPRPMAAPRRGRAGRVLLAGTALWADGTANAGVLRWPPFDGRGPRLSRRRLG